jgi:hypothetical protein
VLVADQIERFAKLRNYHLAGHLPNLDFWLSQVRNALAVLDGYGFRFENMKAAQNEYVRQHQIRIPNRIDPLLMDIPSGPTRIPSHELNQARRRLITATGRFLDCLVREQFMTGEQRRQVGLGLGIDTDQ